MSVTPVKSALVGLVCWFVTGFVLHPSPFDLKWGVLLFLLAPLVLLPLGLQLVEPETRNGVERWLWRYASSLQLPAAIALLTAFAFPAGLLAGLLCLPWLLTMAMISLSGLIRAWRRGVWPLAELSIDAGKSYLIVGAIWALLSRLGVRPLNFEPVIVLLTAIHFHYAGFLLPVMTGLAGRHLKTRVAGIAAFGVITGVPFTAIGITISQLGIGHTPEMLAVLITAPSGLLTAGLHFMLAARQLQLRIVRWCWLIAAISLSFGMLLAVLYGSRFYLELSWLDIPLMRGSHGSINALGFGLIGLIGWYLTGMNEYENMQNSPRSTARSEQYRRSRSGDEKLRVQ
ncbi:MAG: YndJ family protein [Acidobacteria bacterium]|nr:YndJ family protein [Acidobacteriota bacterium]